MIHFVEVEDGVSINLSKVWSFEDFRGKRCKLMTDDGEDRIINVSYETFKQLVGMVQNAPQVGSSGLNQRNLQQGSAYVPRP